MRVLNLDLLIIKIGIRVPVKITSENWQDIEDREEKLMNEMYDYFDGLRRKKQQPKPKKKAVKKAVKKVSKK